MRKLAIFSACFAAAAAITLKINIQFYIMIIFAVTGLAAGFIMYKASRNLLCRRCGVALLGTACAVLWTEFYCINTVQFVQTLEGESKNISVTATDYSRDYNGYSKITAKLDDGRIPAIKVLITDSTGALKGTEPGQSFSLDCVLHDAGRRYGDYYDSYNADGIFLLATVKGNIELHPKNVSLIYIPTKAAHAIKAQIRKLYSGREAAFMKALLTGDKTDMYADKTLCTAFSRAGLMHIVAVSGMHISFLVSMISLFIGKSRRNSIICLVLIWFFVMMTDATPSAVRAGIMQSLMICAPLFKRENDEVTSILFALLIILIVNPYAIFSISLQLSFCAIGGIYFLSGKIFDRLFKNFNCIRRVKVIEYIISVLSSSLAAMVSTTPVCAYHFGSVQLLSPVTNIPVLWAVTLCFSGGIIAAVSSFAVPFVATGVAWITSAVARLINGFAVFFASFNIGTLYTDNSAVVWWVIFVYILLFVYVCPVFRFKRRVLILVSVIISSLFLLTAGTKLYYDSFDGVFSVIDVDQGQALAVFSKDSVVMIDCGNTMSLKDAGESAAKYLLSCGKKKVDLMVLTHLHDDHTRGIDTLMAYIPVKEIVISSYSSMDRDIRNKIEQMAAEHGTIVTYIDSDSTANVGNIRVDLFPPVNEKSENENERCIFTVVSVKEFDMLVTGDSDKHAEKAFLNTHTISAPEVLILGHHGSKYSTSDEILELASRSVCAISTGYNTYGHPAKETIINLEKRNIPYYRTDVSGTLQFTYKSKG